MRKNCSTDREKLLKFEAEGREFENFLRSLEQFIQAVKVQKISYSFTCILPDYVALQPRILKVFLKQ